ncbi:hypothetical protein Tco_1465821 [Tanacetum coccineum]
MALDLGNYKSICLDRGLLNLYSGYVPGVLSLKVIIDLMLFFRTRNANNIKLLRLNLSSKTGLENLCSIGRMMNSYNGVIIERRMETVLSHLMKKQQSQKRIRNLLATNNDDKNLAFLTTSGASSINNINTVNPEVSTGNTKVNTASTEISTASFSDATVYAFLSTQPQGVNIVHEDLELFKW